MYRYIDICVYQYLNNSSLDFFFSESFLITAKAAVVEMHSFPTLYTFVRIYVHLRVTSLFFSMIRSLTIWWFSVIWPTMQLSHFSKPILVAISYSQSGFLAPFCCCTCTCRCLSVLKDVLSCIKSWVWLH